MIELIAKGVLFDLDGTLVDSIASVDRAWTIFAEMRGLVPAEVLPVIHGKKAVDSLRLILPGCDPHAENDVLRKIEVTESASVKPFPGALEFLNSLPEDAWLVVTSGTRDVAESRLLAAGIAIRSTYVTGDEVTFGKPNPEPFMLGASRLNLEACECIAFEDTIAGVQSARSAGCVTIGIGFDLGADYHVSQWTELSVESDESGLLIKIHSPA